jgi:chaperonin GroES
MSEMILEPVADWMVIKPTPLETMTKGGLFIPDSVQQKPKTGTVVAVGKDVKEAKEGNYVLFGKMAGIHINVEETEYLMMRENDVIAIVTKNPHLIKGRD